MGEMGQKVNMEELNRWRVRVRQRERWEMEKVIRKIREMGEMGEMGEMREKVD